MDIPLLYIPVTDQAVENAYSFYGIWFESPGAVKALFHVALLLPLLALFVKLNKWDTSAVYFDGSCIGASLSVSFPAMQRLTAALQAAIIIFYITVHIPSLRTFRESYCQSWEWSRETPEGMILTSVPESTTTTTFSILPPPPPREKPPTEAERVEAVRVMAAGNALVGLLTLGIIMLQFGQEYAKRAEDKLRAEWEAKHGPAVATEETKKTK